LVLAIASSFFSGKEFLSMHEREVIYKGKGVTEIRMLSEYYPGLKDTPGDTEVYILEGSKPGSSMLVLGGTHANEPAGYLAAVTLIENAVIESGTLYVIPRANNSAFTHDDAQEGSPQTFVIETPNGNREFRFGSRATNPIHQWPDSDIYIHASSGQKLSGSETRNLNRAYPGREDGTLTEKIAFGIKELINNESITMTVDLHEASPEYPVINATVAHEDAMQVASMAVIGMAMEGITMGLEPSPTNLHGLTHRELGDYTDTLALLMETANPAQGRLRGKTDEELVVKGIDPIYVQAGEIGRLFVSFDENGHNITDRVARHLTGINEFAKAYNEIYPDNTLVINQIPSYEEFVAVGLGEYLGNFGEEKIVVEK